MIVGRDARDIETAHNPQAEDERANIVYPGVKHPASGSRGCSRCCLAAAAAVTMLCVGALAAARSQPRVAPAGTPDGDGDDHSTGAKTPKTLDLGSGVTLRVLSPGDGKTFATDRNFLYAHFNGTLPDGTVFESTRDSEFGKPFAFSLARGHVVKGWDIALPHMSLGERAIIHVPSELAYGNAPHGSVPAGADLDFDLELVAVDSKAVGLRVETLQQGDGRTIPHARDRVVINFRAFLPGGRKFDDTWERGTPFSFTALMGQVMVGWDLAVATMSVGERTRVHVPSMFANGRKKMGEIPPDTDLDFEFELVSVERMPAGCVLDECPPMKPAGFVPLPSDGKDGLSIDVIVPGDGVHFPKPGETVSVHYVGTLAKDGKEFDSSRRRGKPIPFEVGAGQVIRGWDLGVSKMSLGERARLHIPSSMAYGGKSLPGIPPNSDLVFDVELLAIGELHAPAATASAVP
mmetsp:Transcript_57355/g.166533  ORF Transcript_57355/g.166533 Transcript_57355/m.166533 type:complete len:462 (-) Transcript_57355:240-1625(-)|eukprot:CAMPEP_0176111708 /NCGR_PEP_ID=MMETSP0120_2-20121206/56096_1 /TAXON_ID=160619 /ORGANISM="Kryptoperidinium foliaceum, Strain CCMP 1326" /LENGTH=461 /DNA_ID=CAMNT_0017445925 /DNA_START=35 /DNA_END=1420 /DNA_ORIENTATION=-